MVVAILCQGGLCFFCKEIDIFHYLDLPSYEMKRLGCGDECNVDKARALLHPNVSKNNFSKEVFMVKGPFGGV
jgi:hypothetical protein